MWLICCVTVGSSLGSLGLSFLVCKMGAFSEDCVRIPGCWRFPVLAQPLVLGRSELL